MPAPRPSSGGRIPDHVLETIREQVSLADLIRESGHHLVSKGRAWRGPCPFEDSSNKRSEKFMVDGDHYFCHGCRERGDVITWLTKRQHLSFMDAVKDAAGRIGLDLTPYQRRAADVDSPVERRRTAAVEALATWATLARDTAEAVLRSDPAVSYDGVPLAALIAAGEVGRMPEAERIERYCDALGVGAEARADIGWTPQGAAAMADQWVLIARKHDRVLGGRVVGGWEGVVGPYGERTGGWLMAPTAGNRPLEAPVMVAGDDATYLALRASGVVPVVRPLSRVSLRDRVPPQFTLKDKPPVLLVRPQPASRRQGLTDALPLLGANPRLRIVETDLPARAASLTAPEWAQSAPRLVARAGTVIDWQIRLLSEHPVTETPEGRQQAAWRLARIVHAVGSPLEHAAYQAEAESVTGLPLPSAQDMAAGSPRSPQRR